MRVHSTLSIKAFVLAVLAVVPSQAAIVSFTPSEISNTASGLTTTLTTVGGVLSFSGSNLPSAIGGVPGLGTYTLAFSQPVDALTIRLQDFTDRNGPPRPALLNFLADGTPVTIEWIDNTNSFLDSNIAIATGFGSGSIVYGTPALPSPAFSSFSFDLSQGNELSVFLVRIIVNTAPVSTVPEPTTALTLGLGFTLLALCNPRLRDRK
jgi:hypothetical protein